MTPQEATDRLATLKESRKRILDFKVTVDAWAGDRKLTDLEYALALAELSADINGRLLTREREKTARKQVNR